MKPPISLTSGLMEVSGITTPLCSQIKHVCGLSVTSFIPYSQTIKYSKVTYLQLKYCVFLSYHNQQSGHQSQHQDILLFIFLETIAL